MFIKVYIAESGLYKVNETPSLSNRLNSGKKQPGSSFTIKDEITSEILILKYTDLITTIH